MLKPWQRRLLPAMPKPPEAPLDPVTQARRNLLEQLTGALLPPELKAVASPLLSQALHNINAETGQRAVDLIYDVAEKFRAIDREHGIEEGRRELLPQVTD